MPQLEPTYLRYIYDGLIKGSIHPENAAELPNGLIGMYEEAFDERTSVVERQKLLQRFAIWALLKKEVSAAFVAEVLGETEDDIQDFISTYSAWFNSPESGKYQLYHERLKVYLLQKLSEGELNKLTEQIFQKLKIHFDKTNGNEFHEYAQYYFLDYYNIIVNLNATLKINSELHKGYFSSVQKDATKLFYLENGRNHRDRHLRQATSYFSRKKDLKVLDKLVHEINLFQNKRKTPLELSELIWSSNPNEQFYGYNLCSRPEDKLFVLVYSSIYYKDFNFSKWHLNVIKEYWKELQPTKKIYDIPSFFLLDLVPFLVDLNLFKFEEIEIKKIDYRLIHSLFNYTSFELFEIQRYNEEIFSAFSTASIDLLFQDEIKYRLNNDDYFKRIDLMNKIRDLNDLKFLIDPKLYFDLPSNYEFLKSDEDSLLAHISKIQFSEIYYNKTNEFFSFPLNGTGRDLIISHCLSYIRDGKFNVVIDYLKYLKRDIKFGYTRDSDGASHPADDSWQYNEMIFSIFNFCIFREVLSIQELEEFLFLVIKDDIWNPNFYNALYSFKYLITHSLLSTTNDYTELIISERVKRVACNYLYVQNNRVNALQLFSKLSVLNTIDDQNKNFYETCFANCFEKINIDERILFDYYRNTNDVRSSILPFLNYGIRKNNLPLIWNFAHVNQSEMQKFGPSRSFSWHAISALFSFENIKFNIVFKDFLIPLLNSTKIHNENNRKTSILLDFIEPIESADLIELLNSLKKYFISNYIADYEKLLFQKESDDSLNLKNLSLLKNGYLTVTDKIWKNSDSKEDLKNDLVKLESEKNFIADFNHNLYLLNIYFDHPEYINSIAFYSELFKKYKIKPKPLTGKTRFVSDRLIEQLKWKDNIVPLEVSPSNLMYSSFLLGKGYFEIEDYKTAIKFFKTAILNRKTHSGVNLGNCFLELGKSHYYVNNFGKAIENLNFARIEIPKSKDNLIDLSDCYYFLGLCYEEKKKWNDSIGYYIKCRNLDKRILKKDHKDNITVLKSILRLSNHCGEKYHIKYLKEIINHLNLNAQKNNHAIGYYYLTLARKYRENEDFKLELNSLRKCVKHLNNSHYKTNESRLKIHFLLAKSYEKNNMFLKALMTLKILENEITNVIAEIDIFSFLARNAFKAKKFKLSVNYYLKIENDDANPLIPYKIAYCYEQIGSIKKAHHYYVRYLTKKSEDDVFLSIFKELGDEDFIDLSEEELITALDFIERYSSKKLKIDNWIQKLIELKNENN